MVKTATKAKQLFVPCGLNLGSRLPEKEFKRLPKYYYFLDLLHRERVFNKTYKPDDFIRLKSTYLQRILTTKEAKRVINDLEQWGIIEIDPDYVRATIRRGVLIPGKSKGYRLTNQYRSRQVQTVNLTDEIMLRKLDEQARIDFEPTHDTLICLLNNYMNHVQVDLKAAYNHIYNKIAKKPRAIRARFLLQMRLSIRLKMRAIALVRQQTPKGRNAPPQHQNQSNTPSLTLSLFYPLK